MPVDVGNIVSRAFQIVLRNRVLWVLGLLAALCARGFSLNYSSGSPTLPRATPGVPFNPFGGTDFQFLLRNLVLVGGLSLLLGIILFVLRAWFEASLIAGGDGAAAGRPTTFGAASAAGRARMWPVLGLNLLPILVTVVLGLVAVLPLIPTIPAALSWFGDLIKASDQGGTPPPPPDPLVASLGLLFVTACCAVVLWLVLTIVLTFVVSLGQRAAVLDNQGVGASLRSGWQLLRLNFGNALLLAIIQFVAFLVIGIVVGILVGIPAALLVLPQMVTSNGLPPTGLLLAIAVVGWLIGGIVMALPTAWSSLLWTIFYRAITVGLPQAAPGYAGPLPPLPGSYTGYGTPGGYPPAGAPPPGYGAPPQYPPAYGAPPQYPPAYGAPQQYPPGYGPPPSPPAGYTVPGQYPRAGGPANPYAPPPAPPPPPPPPPPADPPRD